MAEDFEALRFYNFLQYYDLHRHHQKFVDMGVRKISHLKDVDDNDLEQMGLSRPERIRLRKKVDKNFSLTGKLRNSVLGKGNKFDGPSSEDKEPGGLLLQPKDQQQQGVTGPTIINSKQIKLGRKIGEGAYGAVHEATWFNIHGSVTVAVKFLTAKQTDDAYQTFHKEVASMCSLNHPHVIKLYGITVDSPMALVEELAQLGDLHSHLCKCQIPFKYQMLHTYACQIADAMQYLEAQRVIHRDLATRNVLLVEEDFVKLSDFGMARVLKDHSSVYNLTNMNTRIPIAWSSLEALQRAKFSTASDVWSYGVTLWEIYSLGEAPWEGLSPVEIRDKLAVGERLGRPSTCPIEIYQLMQSCWNAIPTKRPTFQYIHQTIQELSPKKVLAIRSHIVDGDDILNFKAGEVIFVVDRPKPGWMYGIKATGEKGHFQEECTSTELHPLDKLKEMVQTGKTKATDLTISKPTFVAHDYHWGTDGKCWVSEEAPEGTGVAMPKVPSSSVLGTGANTLSPCSNSPTPPVGGGRYIVAAAEQPLPPSTGNLLHQRHSGYDLSSTPLSPPPVQSSQVGSSSTATNKRFSPPGDFGGTEKLSSPPAAGYVAPPHKHTNGDHCACMTSGQRLQQDCNGAPERLTQLPKEEGEEEEVEDHKGTGDDEEEYMVLSSPKAPSMEAAGYIKMRPSRADYQKVAPIEYGSCNGRTVSGPTEGTGPALPSRGVVAVADVPVPTARQRHNVVPPPPPILLKPSSTNTPPPPSSLLDGPPTATVSDNPFSAPLIPLPRTPPVAAKDVPAVPPRTAVSPNRHISTDAQVKVQPPIPLPRRNISVPELTPMSPEHAKPHYFVNIAHKDMPLVDVLQLEFPNANPFECKKALEIHSYNLAKAREHLQIEQLMAMCIPKTTAQDCRRALEHCQYSVDRAAGWLLDRTMEK